MHNLKPLNHEEIHKINEQNDFVNMTGYKVEAKGVKAEFNPLINLKTTNSQHNLIFIHPIGGDVICYRELSAQLSASVNVFGLRARGLDLSEPVYECFDRMIDEYATSIIALGTEGELHLAGQSLGGIISIAVAHALQEKGVNVDKIFMIDTYSPSDLNTFFGNEVDMVQGALGITLPDHLRELQQKEPDQWLQVLFKMIIIVCQQTNLKLS